MKIWHLRFSSDGRHPLFPAEGARRSAVRVLARHAGRRLVAFGIADDHAHVVLLCSRERAGKLSRAILLGLRPLSDMGFEPSFIKAVDDRKHLLRLITYTIKQPTKHGLPTHPAPWSGSCFADVVGTRVIDGLHLRVADVLPRYRPGDAWRAVGFPAPGLLPLTDDQVFVAGLSAIKSAASFATGTDPSLTGRAARDTRARLAAVDLGRRAGYQPRSIAAAMGISAEAVRKLSLRAPDERTTHAIRLRLAVEARVGVSTNLWTTSWGCG